MNRLNDIDIKVTVTAFGETYELRGVADISDGINTDMVRGVIELDPELIKRKVNQEVAGKLREMADLLEQGS